MAVKHRSRARTIIGGHHVFTYWEVAYIDDLVPIFWFFWRVQGNFVTGPIVTVLKFYIFEPSWIVRVTATVRVPTLLYVKCHLSASIANLI